jgi:glycine cleavage system H protein
MSNIPSSLRYTKDHEWAKADGNTVTVGITDHAQSQLGDIVFLELPEVGRELAAGETFGVVESVKAVSDLYAPLAGKVTEINEGLVDAPEGINEDPYDKGWLLRIEVGGIAEFEGLMGSDDYQSHVDSEA